MLQALRTKLLNDPCRKDSVENMQRMVNVSSVREAARAFKRTTAIGTDAVSFLEIAKASDESLEHLVGIIHRIIDDLAFPTQAMVNAITLLGKRHGGTRTVATCSTIYRLVIGLLKEEVRLWDRSTGMEGDTALRTRNALVETAKRHARIEAASLRGDKCVYLLRDIAKIFISVHIPQMIENALKEGFPPHQLLVGMQVHTAPRVVRALGSVSAPLSRFGGSIIAGCSLSTSFCRAYLLPVLRDVEPIDGGYSLHQHVDDIG